jgi:hypothetical protein
VETTERGDRGLKEAQRQGDIMDSFFLFFKFVEILSIQNAENACYNSVSLVNIIVYAKRIRNSKIQC